MLVDCCSLRSWQRYLVLQSFSLRLSFAVGSGQNYLSLKFTSYLGVMRLCLNPTRKKVFLDFFFFLNSYITASNASSQLWSISTAMRSYSHFMYNGFTCFQFLRLLFCFFVIFIMHYAVVNHGHFGQCESR